MFDWFHVSPDDGEEEETRDLVVTPILLEIVGAMRLASKKMESVDPYAVVSINNGEQVVHRTKTIQNDDCPIWTIKTKSLCLVEIPQEAADAADSTNSSTTDTTTGKQVTVSVLDGSTCLGRVHLTFGELLEGNGERQEYVLGPEQANSILALRFRKALPDDLRFLQKIPGVLPKFQVGLASDINFHSVKKKSFFQQYHKVKDQQEYIRVMPFPDPDRLQEETEWMTREEMAVESYKPSKRWVSAGHGKIGKIFLEILGCDQLPKMDINLNDDTDAFVGIVFEDTMVRTDVIWDERNPRWLPWTNRAFELRVRHPASILMLGVFDYDETPVDYHDPIGRVVISTANFRCNTEYVLHYKLHHDPRQADTEPRGTIIIRMRIEWEDESEAMKMSFTPAPRFIINVDNDKSYRVLRYITRGAVDMEKPSIDSVKLYANELVSYWQNYCFVLDVVMEVLLWRGQIQVSATRSVWFPIHSMALFLAAVLLMERPDKAVPIFFYSVAWILLSINYHASRHPYPWKRVKKSEEINKMALFGRSSLCPETIEPGQGVTEGLQADQLDKLKAERMSTLIQALLSFALKVYRVYSKTSQSGISMATQTADWSFLSGRLTYIHMMLKYLCKYIRLFRNFVNWKSYSADVFTTNCIMIATLWLIFPVNTIALWTLRIVTWTILGPWMKFVDIYLVHSWYETKDELVKRIQNGDDDSSSPKLPNFDALLESKTLIKMGHSGRVVAEDSLKLKDMREELFGYYSEIVPRADTSRFPSVPLPLSTAVPVVPTEDRNDDETRKNWYHVPGQQLEGSMIHSRPRFEKAALEGAALESSKKTQ